MKIDFADKDMADFPLVKKDDGGLKITFTDLKTKVNILKHDKLARRDNCYLDFELEEK